MIGNEEYQYSNNYVRLLQNQKKEKEFVFNLFV